MLVHRAIQWQFHLNLARTRMVRCNISDHRCLTHVQCLGNGTTARPSICERGSDLAPLIDTSPKFSYRLNRKERNDSR